MTNIGVPVVVGGLDTNGFSQQRLKLVRQCFKLGSFTKAQRQVTNCLKHNVVLNNVQYELIQTIKTYLAFLLDISIKHETY